MNNEFQPRKAQKSKVKLKLALQGPSGSGKTEGALALATNFIPNAKILVVDTENDSASLYADRYDFDTISLSAPYTSKRYQQAMRAAVDGGYDVLVVDSITHQWDGEGGILRRKEAKDREGGNSFTNWSSFTPEHTEFVEFIKQLPVHTIVTMRSKQTHVLEAGGMGKQTVRKMGMDPIQREGMEYEYTIVFDVSMGHRAKPSKNRTTLFQDDESIDLVNPQVAASIQGWLENGIEAPKKVFNVPPPSPADYPFSYVDNELSCFVTDTKRTESRKKEEYFVLQVNGKILGRNTIYCWRVSLFPALSDSKGQMCRFRIEEKGEYANVIDVIAIGDQEYRDGKKWEPSSNDDDTPPAEPEQPNSQGLLITDDDIPF